MKLHQILIGVFVAGILILGFTSFLNSIGGKYDKTADTTMLGNTTHSLDVQKNLTENLKKNITSLTLNTGGLETFEVPYKLLQISWQIGRMFFNGWGVFTSMIEDIRAGLSSAGIDLPNWLITFGMTMFFIMIIAIILYGFFKWKMED